MSMPFRNKLLKWFVSWHSMLKNGENPNLDKLQSKLTIGGADVTVSQLMEMQKVGKEISNAFQTSALAP